MLFWNDAWENDKTLWHKEDVHPAICDHLDKLTKGKERAKLFLPLCGKSLDILHLAKLGHAVVGVEYSEKGVKEFFEENNLSFKSKPVEKMEGELYENTDYQIKLYRGDIFKFSSEIEKGFDGIWDRGSLVAIDVADREKYSQIIKSVLKPGAGYLLEAPDRPAGNGPPFYVSIDDIMRLLGLKDQPELIGYVDAPSILRDQGCNGFFNYSLTFP